MSNATRICWWALQTDLNCDWCFFDDVPNGLRGLCGTKWTKNGVKMKLRRTEKTVRRNFIYMEKASKNAVKQKQLLSPQDCLWYTNGLEVASQPLLRCPKYGGVTPYFDRCAILASLHLPPAALGDEARHARASDKFCLTKKKQSPKWWLFLFGRGRRTWTLGTRFWRPLLYQLSYTPIYGGPSGTRTPDQPVMSRWLWPTELMAHRLNVLHQAT